jgi:glycosyltransferase involved in cell wall biosynthesis
LFRGLSQFEDLRIDGLLQHSELLLARGLSPGGKRWGRRIRPNVQVNRLGGVVISLEQDSLLAPMLAAGPTLAMAVRHLFGGRQRLTRFDARQFRDYVWRHFFAQTLPPDDFDIVTRAGFRIERIPWNALHLCALVFRKLGVSLYPRLDTSEFDVFVTQTPFPGTVSRNTLHVVHYHDALPLLMPHTISLRNYHQAFHYHALRKNVESGAWFVCVSEATRKDLLAIFPQVEARSVTIHNMISREYRDEATPPDRVPQIVAARLSTRIEPELNRVFRRNLFAEAARRAPLQYLLMVGKMEPRKNHLALLAAWEKLRSESFPALNLVVVGPLGQQHAPIIRRFYPWLERCEAFVLEDLTSADMRLLYKHACATVCPSLGEGFDFSGVEAMKSGGAVVASNIPAHLEIYGDAAEFFNAYSVEDLCRAIRAVIEPANAARREELVAKGAAVSKRYDADVIMPKWEAFLKARAEQR